jgi:hypothetical protein
VAEVMESSSAYDKSQIYNIGSSFDRDLWDVGCESFDLSFKISSPQLKLEDGFKLRVDNPKISASLGQGKHIGKRIP